MFKLDDNFLTELGLGSLPVAEKNKMLAHIYETLEMKVGMRLAEKMSNEQLDEFEGFINNNDEAGALKWLESNFPNYKQVVAEELEKLKGEIRQVAPQIVSQAASTLPPANGAPGVQQPSPPLPPQGSQPPLGGPAPVQPSVTDTNVPPPYQPAATAHNATPPQQPMPPQFGAAPLPSAHAQSVPPSGMPPAGPAPMPAHQPAPYQPPQDHQQPLANIAGAPQGRPASFGVLEPAPSNAAHQQQPPSFGGPSPDPFPPISPAPHSQPAPSFGGQPPVGGGPSPDPFPPFPPADNQPIATGLPSANSPAGPAPMPQDFSAPTPPPNGMSGPVNSPFPPQNPDEEIDILGGPQPGAALPPQNGQPPANAYQPPPAEPYQPPN